MERKQTHARMSFGPHDNATQIDCLLTYKQAGKFLGVTERTVWTLVSQGEIPSVKFGRSVRIDPADLRAYIDNCKSQVNAKE